MSLGDEVIAVTVCYADPDDMAADVSFRDEWAQMAPRRGTGHAPHHPSGAGETHRAVPARRRAERLLPPARRADPRSPAPATPGSTCCTTSAASSWTGPSVMAQRNVVLCLLRFRLDQVVRPALPPGKENDG